LRNALVGMRGAGVVFGALASPLQAQETRFGADLFIYHNRPFGNDAPPPRTEVYAAILTGDVEAPRWRLHAQVRARDQLLREFYPGTIWLQQAWAAYEVVPAAAPATLTLRAGKIDQVMGLIWDGSFSGNIQYFDGLKRNPSFGAEASGALRLDGATLGYTVQFMLDSDPVSGAIPGRDFSTIEGFRNRDGVFARVTAELPTALTADRPPTLTLGVSAAARGVAERNGSGEDVFHVPHLGADAEVRAGPATAYVEWLHRGYGQLPDGLRSSLPGSEATYWLAGARLHHGPFTARYNHSRASYAALDRRDWIHQPGVGYDITSHVHALAEVNIWRFQEPDGPGVFARSLNVVLRLGF
jgi:hypothetical protein